MRTACIATYTTQLNKFADKIAQGKSTEILVVEKVRNLKVNVGRHMPSVCG